MIIIVYLFLSEQFNSLANTYWILEVGSDIHKTREPYLVVNSQEGLIACAKKGLGIIQMPSVLIKFRNENNQLLNILKETTGPIIDVYGIYPSKTKNLKRINLFMDYLEDKLLKDDLYN